ncbi:4-hydroxybenzoate polyprenyltransferase, mitochondrial [Dichanthelium oligosanthes]|uniref:4-hydroxybenzoate polyprenyltransferase, mitochondrial n=1 Tax=Dichanthelium oligosanthes TaxID=888268 RepID=A0A1E5WK68_9POAL|nr:4-hydroxybenzoate polyprenyltransferase, mitochondrial [Dichanthelium oligosanthes]
MKRVTYWPQAYLGLAINCGVVLGWAAIKESLDTAVIIPLYTGATSICWALVYDIIYAHQDKEDDIKVGVKSTALLFGDMTKCISALGTACISSLALSAYNADLDCMVLLSFPDSSSCTISMAYVCGLIKPLRLQQEVCALALNIMLF